MKFKYQAKRPKRDQLHGLSPSELKTLLRRRGYDIGRDFFKYGCQARYRGRSYRFRWYSDGEFFVDKSCVLSDFDRWANSVDEVITFYNWLEGHE
jgi:hypothetical protein